MGRRTVLLVVAALIAALGTGVVVLYVRGADNRAEASQKPLQVLKAVQRIDGGETFAAAQAAGKIELGSVPKAQVLPGAVNTTTGLEKETALTTIYPNEQITSNKFGSASGTTTALEIPKGDIAISVNLTDTGRVAGFVSPGNDVAIFADGKYAGADQVRLLLARVEVIAIGDTTAVKRTVTDSTGAATTEVLPNTLFTLSLPQKDAEKVLFAASRGALSFGLLNTTSKVSPQPGVTTNNLFK